MFPPVPYSSNTWAQFSTCLVHIFLDWAKLSFDILRSSDIRTKRTIRTDLQYLVLKICELTEATGNSPATAWENSMLNLQPQIQKDES